MNIINDSEKYFFLALTVLFLFPAGQKNSLSQTYSRGYSRTDKEGTAELIEKIAEYPNDGGLFQKLKKRIPKETDSELQKQGLAVYALGAMARGHMRSGGSARKLLLKKFPASKYSQALSLKRLGRVCAVCDGEGRIGRACPVCEGSGKCQMCEGKGVISKRLVDAEDASCPNCGGTGDCAECDGERESYRKCHNCSGRGFVLDKSKVEECYQSVLQAKPEEFLEETATIKTEEGPSRDGNQLNSEEKAEKEEEDENDDEEDVLQYF